MTIERWSDHLFITAPVSGWDKLAASEHFALKVNVLEAGNMGKCKDLSEFDKWWLDDCVTASLTNKTG